MCGLICVLDKKKKKKWREGHGPNILTLKWKREVNIHGITERSSTCSCRFHQFTMLFADSAVK